MNRASWILVFGVALSALIACNNKGGGDTAPSASPDPATTTEVETATSSTAEPEESASADTEDSAAPEDSAKTADGKDPDPKTKGTAAPTASVAAGKKYDCGSKGQKACPMQGWMKGVMARAMASGDGAKIAKALNTIAAKPVAGYGSWSGIAAAGAAKAAAGDIDGAKASCKKCHSLYQKKYIATRRDQPW